MIVIVHCPDQIILQPKDGELDVLKINKVR